MNTSEYDYGEILEPRPTGKAGQDILANSHVFIIAWDSDGKRYAFGTTPKMLKEKSDAERFKTCDLSRYPVGPPTGFVNRVMVIQTYDGTIPYRTTVDEAMRMYDSHSGVRVLREL